jgi:RimJ/RimL family protein N-acetyltransferase
MLLYEADRDVCDWASRHIFGAPGRFNELCSAIGVVEDNQLIAGVIYSNYCPGHSIEMSVASVDKRWATRHNLKAFFHFPFIELRLERVWTQCSVEQEGVIMFNKRLGFKQEGYHPKGWPLGGDSLSFGLLKEDCKWC